MSVFNQKTRVEKWKQTPDDDNENMLSDGTTVISEEEKHTACLEYDCGAYYDGRCHYSEHI